MENITPNGGGGVGDAAQLDERYVKKDGDETIHGKKYFATSPTYLKNEEPRVACVNTAMTKGVAPSKDLTVSAYRGTDSNVAMVGEVLCVYHTDLGVTHSLKAYSANGKTVKTSEIVAGVDGNNNIYTSAPTPPILDNSTQIATTAWVSNRFSHNGTLTIYVRKNGNDSNDGLTENTAVLTINKALSIGYQYAIVNGTMDINIGEGTWDESLTIRRQRACGTSGAQISITGAGKEKTIIQNTGTVVTCRGNSLTQLTNMTIKGLATNTYTVTAYISAHIYLVGTKIISRGYSAIYATESSSITLYQNDNAIECNNSQNAILANTNSMFNMTNATLNLTGSVSSAIVRAQWGGNVVLSGSFTGNMTGARYYATNCGVIATGGKGAEFIPGTKAGILETGGQYV